MSHPLIILSGYAGSGKSTAAKHLCLDYGFTELSFAAPLKNMVAETYRIPRESLDHPTIKNKPLRAYPADPKDPMAHLMGKIGDELFWTPRTLAILEGMTKRRVYGDYWYSRLLMLLVEELKVGPVVVSDCRFPNELEALKKYRNSHHLRILRGVEVVIDDESEHALDNAEVDCYIPNFGNSPSALYDNLKLFLMKINHI